MPRHARIVVPGLLHHITQRGNRRQQVFFDNEDREFFLDRLAYYADRAALLLASYCLMTNHSHILGIPQNPDSLARTFKPLHLCYSQRLNHKFNQSGLNWQGRFFSSPLDSGHAYTAFQYVALNPVRAGMVKRVEDYQWSSAGDHLNNQQNILLTAGQDWLLQAHKAVKEIDQQDQHLTTVRFRLLRQNTFSNLPTASDEFVSKLEEQFGRRLVFGKAGRPRK